MPESDWFPFLRRTYFFKGLLDEEIRLVASACAEEERDAGDVIFVELPDPGTAISVEQSMGSIESAKAVEDIIAPISGEVVSVNEDVVDAPELLNEDPYEVGWLISVKPRDIKDLDSLLGHDQYMSLVEESGDYGEDEEEEEEDLFTNDE